MDRLLAVDAEVVHLQGFMGVLMLPWFLFNDFNGADTGGLETLVDAVFHVVSPHVDMIGVDLVRLYPIGLGSL